MNVGGREEGREGGKTYNKGSVVVEMATQCCTIWMFAVECGIPRFNALFLSSLWDCHHKSLHCWKVDSVMATTPLNVVEGHNHHHPRISSRRKTWTKLYIQCQCKAHMQLLCINSNLPLILHTVVSEIWQIIGPIFAMDRKCLFLTHLLGMNP